MEYTFSITVPELFTGNIIPLSQQLPHDFNNYVTGYTDGLPVEVYGIGHDYKSGSFKQAIRFKDLLLIGLGEYFYAYDISKKELKVVSVLQFYFSKIYVFDERFLVCDACNIYCYNKDCQLIWRADNLGIDGVIINQFTNGILIGEGENDPPGGWITFKIDFQTGKIL